MICEYNELRWGVKAADQITGVGEDEKRGRGSMQEVQEGEVVARREASSIVTRAVRRSWGRTPTGPAVEWGIACVDGN